MMIVMVMMMEVMVTGDDGSDYDYDQCPDHDERDEVNDYHHSYY